MAHDERCSRHSAAWTASLVLLFLCGAGARADPTLDSSPQAPARPAPPAAEPPAAAAAAAAPLPPAEEKYGMIVVFREAKSLASLRVMCMRNALTYRIASRPLHLPVDCHTPGICRRVYSTAVLGFAGEFSNQELRTLQRCLPEAVWYRELDGRVQKAEDTSMMRRTPGPNRRRALLQETKPSAAPTAGGEAPFVGIPRVTSFEVHNRTDGSSSGPIDVVKVTGGGAMWAEGEKRQELQPVLWNLDRLDQRELPLDGEYRYGSDSSSGTGAGVTIYVVDSGIKTDHQEFKTADGSGSRASYGFDFVDDDEDASDCDGHGSHVSATAAGLQVGVAKGANVVGVRILDCAGSGTISDTVAALDWVAANAKKPAVVTLSLGIQVGSWSRVLEDAVRSLVYSYGITVVVASGNSNVDACYVAPANVPEVITVAASDLGTKYNTTKNGDKEATYKWGNTGPCVDLFAPGVDIYSACASDARCEEVDDRSYTYASGTSMAAPHVAGVAALYLQDHPKAAPKEVVAALLAGASQGLVDPANFKQGTANRLLYSRLQAARAVAAANGP